MDCGAFACGLALDLLVCGIGAAFCGVDECLAFDSVEMGYIWCVYDYLNSFLRSNKIVFISLF